MNVTGLRDWARLGGGGFNAEGNAILYRVYFCLDFFLALRPLTPHFFQVLQTSALLASYLNLTDLSSAWTANATALKATFNEVFWDTEQGMYRDNSSTTLCPQDANSFAVLFNVTNSTAQAATISEGLQRNWNELGAVAPEVNEVSSIDCNG